MTLLIILLLALWAFSLMVAYHLGYLMREAEYRIDEKIKNHLNK